MTISGKGKEVTLGGILNIGEHASLNSANVLSLLDQVRHGTSLFSELSEDYGIPGSLKKQISGYIRKQLDSISP